jgi:hypothetical protein
MNKPIPSPDLLKEEAFVAVGEKASEVPGDFVISGENDAEGNMLDDREATACVEAKK